MFVITEQGNQMLQDHLLMGAKEFTVYFYVAGGCRYSGNFVTIQDGLPRASGLDPAECTKLEEHGYTFYVHQLLMEQAGEIVIDATGGVPVLMAKNGITITG